jgi:hypothetical protein
MCLWRLHINMVKLVTPWLTYTTGSIITLPALQIITTWTYRIMIGSHVGITMRLSIINHTTQNTDSQKKCKAISWQTEGHSSVMYLVFIFTDYTYFICIHYRLNFMHSMLRGKNWAISAITKRIRLNVRPMNSTKQQK